MKTIKIILKLKIINLLLLTIPLNFKIKFILKNHYCFLIINKYILIPVKVTNGFYFSDISFVILFT